MGHLIQRNIFKSQLSTALLDTTTPNNWTNIVSTSDNLTADVNYAGNAIIIDRLSDKFNPKMNKVTWNTVTGLVPPNTDGNNVVYVYKDGTVGIIGTNNPDLPIYDPAFPDNPNQNNSIQIGLVITDGGTIIEAAGFVEYRGSNMLRFSNLLSKFLGVINSSANPVIVSPVGGNLEMEFSDGEILSLNVGTITSEDFQNPDTRIVSGQSPATMLLVDRNSVIQGVGTNVNVTQYESSPGVFSLVPMNQFKVAFFRIVPGSQFLGYVLGQAVYGTAQDAINANESPDFPEILSRSANSIALIIERNETDLNNSVQYDLTRIP